MIDSHCHLEMPEFDRDFSGVLKRMSEAGVTNAVSIGSLAINERIEKTLEIAGSYDFIKTTLGVHPKSPFKSLPDIKGLFEDYYGKNENKVVAVGEIGLDYFLPDMEEKDFKRSVEIQDELFRFQLELALKYRLPVIVHVRDAYPDALRILKEYANSPSGFHGGVIHCFSSPDAGIAAEFLELGFFISFSGNVTYKKNEGLRLAAAGIPPEKILVETDSPYLAPQKFRGKRNEPSYVKIVLETIADVKGFESQRFDELTVQNTVNIFSLDNVEGYYPGVAYKIRNSVYVNLTNKCTNRCTFCPKYQEGVKNFNVRGYNLELKKEPTALEALSSVFRYPDFEEVVFCGLGEPTLRLEILKETARLIRDKAAANKGLKIRLDTDGLAGAVYGRNVAKELEGLVDSVSISLNAHNSGFYNSVCVPALRREGTDAYSSVLDFIKESKKYIGNVTVTAVDLPGLDTAAVEGIARNLGVKFRLRPYNKVG